MREGRGEAQFVRGGRPGLLIFALFDEIDDFRSTASGTVQPRLNVTLFSPLRES